SHVVFVAPVQPDLVAPRLPIFLGRQLRTRNLGGTRAAEEQQRNHRKYQNSKSTYHEDCEKSAYCRSGRTETFHKYKETKQTNVIPTHTCTMPRREINP